MLHFLRHLDSLFPRHKALPKCDVLSSPWSSQKGPTSSLFFFEVGSHYHGVYSELLSSRHDLPHKYLSLRVLLRLACLLSEHYSPSSFLQTPSASNIKFFQSESCGELSLKCAPFILSREGTLTYDSMLRNAVLHQLPGLWVCLPIGLPDASDECDDGVCNLLHSDLPCSQFNQLLTQYIRRCSLLLNCGNLCDNIFDSGVISADLLQASLIYLNNNELILINC